MAAYDHLAPDQARDRDTVHPGSRALSLAQEPVRFGHPKLGMQRPDSHEAAGETLRHWLRRAGHPRADDAYVVRHYQLSRGSSNTGRGPGGEPAVLLHCDRWDYGTLAHETAHLIRDHETGRKVNEPEPEGVHDPGFVSHYARLLNAISKDAGRDLRPATPHDARLKGRWRRRDERDHRAR